MHQDIPVCVNGNKKTIAENSTLEEALSTLNLKPSFFAVAVNEQFVPRSRYRQVILQPDDKIEIVAPMVGG